MGGKNSAPLHLIFVVLAMLLFGLAAFLPPWGGTPNAPWYHSRLVSAGLFFWVLSTFFQG
jgi:hypothetical protein